MEQRRLMRVLQAVGAQQADALVERICWAAATCLDADVAISLALDDGLLQLVCATEAGQLVDGLQSDLGEGPAYSAHRDGLPVFIDDLAVDGSWPAFSPAAGDLGVHSMFAFPLRSGSVQLGAFTLSRAWAGGLSIDQHDDALVFARLTVDLLLALQAGREVDELDQLFVDGTSNTAEIHQAAGMVSVQLGITVAAALSVLRAHAYADARPLRELAQEVVARRLRLDQDG